MESPDALEKVIRFMCGFLFGVLAGVVTVALSFQAHGTFIAATGLISGVLCGLLAMRYGDEFWYSIKSWWF